MNDFVPLVPVAELPPTFAPTSTQLTEPLSKDSSIWPTPRSTTRSTRLGHVRYDNHLGARLTELVRLAVAQTTQCQLCLSGRDPTALADGLTEQMVIELVADDRPHLAPAEEAAVNFALMFASDHTAITEQQKKELQTYFTPYQIIELGLLCVMCHGGSISMLAGIECRLLRRLRPPLLLAASKRVIGLRRAPRADWRIATIPRWLAAE